METTAECVHMSPRAGGFHKQTQHACCFWHSEVVNKGTLNTEALLSSAAGMVDLPRQQEKCGCKGEWERDTEPERERAHWASLYLSKDATLPSFHLLFWPQGLQGPARLEQMQHFQYKSLNPNTQMCTYIFLSLQLSFFSHSFPPYNSLSAHPQGKAWIWRRQPKKHMQTRFLRVRLPWNVARVVSAATFIYLYIYLDKDFWILTLIFAVTFSAFFLAAISIVNTTLAVSGYCHSLYYLVSLGE